MANLYEDIENTLKYNVYYDASSKKFYEIGTIHSNGTAECYRIERGRTERVILPLGFVFGLKNIGKREEVLQKSRKPGWLTYKIKKSILKKLSLEKLAQSA